MHHTFYMFQTFLKQIHLSNWIRNKLFQSNSFYWSSLDLQYNQHVSWIFCTFCCIHLRLYLPVSFDLQSAAASVSLQINWTASPWLGNFKIIFTVLWGILCPFSRCPAFNLFAGSTSTAKTAGSRTSAHTHTETHALACTTHCPEKRQLLEMVSCVAVHHHSLNPRLETRSALKIK